MDNEYWVDRDGGQWTARNADPPYTCEYDGDVDCPEPVMTEVQCYDDEPGGWHCLCEKHYAELRADPFHNPESGYADAYVNLGETL